MENASKALIIAGSILITILVISLGIMIFRNMSNSVTSNSSLSKEEIASFNNNITPYLGEKKSGSQVNALIQLVRSINQKAITEDTNKKVKITFPKTGGGTVTLKTDNSFDPSDSNRNVATGGTFYKVEAHYGDNGLIDSITVN